MLLHPPFVFPRSGFAFPRHTHGCSFHASPAASFLISVNFSEGRKSWFLWLWKSACARKIPLCRDWNVWISLSSAGYDNARSAWIRKNGLEVFYVIQDCTKNIAIEKAELYRDEKYRFLLLCDSHLDKFYFLFFSVIKKLEKLRVWIRNWPSSNNTHFSYKIEKTKNLVCDNAYKPINIVWKNLIGKWEKKSFPSIKHFQTNQTPEKERKKFLPIYFLIKQYSCGSTKLVHYPLEIFIPHLPTEKKRQS